MVRAIIDSMARYTVNDAAVARARRLIKAVELAAHDLLQLLGKRAGIGDRPARR